MKPAENLRMHAHESGYNHNARRRGPYPNHPQQDSQNENNRDAKTDLGARDAVADWARLAACWGAGCHIQGKPELKTANAQVAVKV